jgi:hypothetical protein
MNFQSFNEALLENPDHDLLLCLPSGTTLAQHFHVTEVANVVKDFVDCGGVRRKTTTCILQTLVADDVEHRIKAGKLAGILEKASGLGLEPSMAVEAEIQEGTISIYAFSGVEVVGQQLHFALVAKQTACLAPDSCGLEPDSVSLPVPGTGNC